MNARTTPIEWTAAQKKRSSSDSIEIFLDQAMVGHISWRETLPIPGAVVGARPPPDAFDEDDAEPTLSGPPGVASRVVDALVDDAMRALLSRDLVSAARIFRAVVAYDPHHRLARVNLTRLESMGL